MDQEREDYPIQTRTLTARPHSGTWLPLWPRWPSVGHLSSCGTSSCGDRQPINTLLSHYPKMEQGDGIPRPGRCRGQDLNLHSLDGNQALNLARLPIPPPRQVTSELSRPA